MFVLPNLFTVSSIFCGFYAMSLCAGEATPAQLNTAAFAIFFALFFDGFDGRVARLTRTQSEFGVELDSLADVVSFGAAPALLAYKWVLQGMGLLGLCVAFFFATCAALRLARFNVMAHRKVPGSSTFFTGLPVPFAAGTIISLVIARHSAGQTEVEHPGWIALLVVALALLMVSNVRYRTFKDLRLNWRSVSIFLAIILAGVLVAVLTSAAAYVLVAYFVAYLALGFVEGLISIVRRRVRTGTDRAVRDEEERREGASDGPGDGEELL